MKINAALIVLITPLMIASCSLFKTSQVPDWYTAEYDESQYLYGKGRASSAREDLANKKAETAASSDLNNKISEELKRIVGQTLARQGIAADDSLAQPYYDSTIKLNRNIAGLTESANKEVRKAENVYHVFLLLRVNREELEKRYLDQLSRN